MALLPGLSAGGRQALEMMLRDQRRLLELGLLPELNVVNGYVEREQAGPMRTDVRSFHVDSATVEADTWLCTYHGACSEGLRHEEAVRRVDVPETRAALWEAWKTEKAEQGEMEEREREQEQEFREWLNDHFFDLHFVPVAGARPYSFGVGNLWRVGTEWPGAQVPACVHRAPEVGTGGEFKVLGSGFKVPGAELEGVRLLLIS